MYGINCDVRTVDTNNSDSSNGSQMQREVAWNDG